MSIRDYISSFMLFAVGLVAILASVGLSLTTMIAIPGRPILVVTAPWNDASVLITDFGGAILQTGPLKSIAVGFSATPEYIENLQRNGALIVADSALSDLFCLTPNG